MSESRADEVIADFLDAARAGQKPDPQEWLARYPDLTEELSSFFADRTRFEDAAHPLKPSVGPVRYFGDYEVIEEIARGGMGIVYRARQVSLNRSVALKMILQGQLADEREVRRFHDEAEAAANLDHPHIVPIFEIGEYEGRHYFSMKLIEGGNLGAHVEKLRGNFSGIARLMVTIAGAVHHAHQRRILHRDLKPGNILIDAEGQPFVTDFGLAKRIEGTSNLTQSGALVGTAEYMSPEQARGEKNLTTAVDIYGLGAVLHVLLTGRPPFQSDNLHELLKLVVEREPASIQSLNAAVPRDLETICLKCLQKDPTKRYGSAEALADDLDRWRGNRPIVARPVGTFERAVKWAKRQPAVAALLAALLLSLFLGAGVATWFALEARRSAYEATKSALEARQNAEDAQKQKTIAIQKAEELVTVLIGSIQRVIGHESGPPKAQEMEALWALAQVPDQRIRMKVITEGLKDEETTIRLGNRADELAVAAIGLNRERRDQVLRAVEDQLKETGLSKGHREGCAKIALSLQTRDSIALKTALELRLRTIEQRLPAYRQLRPAVGPLREFIADDLNDLRSFLDQMEGEAIGEALDLLVKELQNDGVAMLYVELLAPLAARADAAVAKRFARTLVNRVRETSNPQLGPSLNAALGQLLRRIHHKDVRVLAQATTDDALKGVAQWSLLAASQEQHLQERGLKDIVDRLSPEDVERVAGLLVKDGGPVVIRDSDFVRRAWGLRVLASRVKPDAARRWAGDLVKLLEATTPGAGSGFAKGIHPLFTSRLLVILAPLLDEKSIHRVAETLLKSLTHQPGLVKSHALGECLNAIWEKLPPAETARITESMAAAIHFGLKNHNTPEADWLTLAGNLEWVMSKLPPDEGVTSARAAADILIERIRQRPENSALDRHRFVVVLANVLKSLPEEEAKRVAGRAVDLFFANFVPNRELWNDGTGIYLARNVSPLVNHFDQATCLKVTDVLVRAVNHVQPGLDSSSITSLLRAAASKLDAAGTRELAKQFVGCFQGGRLSEYLFEEIRAVSPRLDEQGARVLAQALSAQAVKVSEVKTLQWLAELLQAIAPRMKIEESRQHALLLFDALKRQSNKTQPNMILSMMAQGMGALLPLLEPAEARKAATMVAQVLADRVGAADEWDIQFLATSLGAVATHLDEQETRGLAQRLVAKIDSNLDKSWKASRMTGQDIVLKVLSRWATPQEIRRLALRMLEHLLIGTVRVSGDLWSVSVARQTEHICGQLGAEDAPRIAQTIISLLNSATGKARAALLDALAVVAKKLDDQALVELLKHPSCIGSARDAVLRELSRRARQAFLSLWDFVAWAEKHTPALSLFSPPRRAITAAQIDRSFRHLRGPLN